MARRSRRRYVRVAASLAAGVLAASCATGVAGQPERGDALTAEVTLDADTDAGTAAGALDADATASGSDGSRGTGAAGEGEHGQGKRGAGEHGQAEPGQGQRGRDGSDGRHPTPGPGAATTPDERSTPGHASAGPDAGPGVPSTSRLSPDSGAAPGTGAPASPAGPTTIRPPRTIGPPGTIGTVTATPTTSGTKTPRRPPASSGPGTAPDSSTLVGTLAPLPTLPTLRPLPTGSLPRPPAATCAAFQGFATEVGMIVDAVLLPWTHRQIDGIFEPIAAHTSALPASVLQRVNVLYTAAHLAVGTSDAQAADIVFAPEVQQAGADINAAHAAMCG